ncbi:uncharacterized protein METZ01_LOCUS294648 [marine metagenome]|uniref:Uncharacterized protein n=1 Tax=marine metagenome TaxID=408172 RepID=A0A382LYG5_9ZZZZ
MGDTLRFGMNRVDSGRAQTADKKVF